MQLITLYAYVTSLIFFKEFDFHHFHNKWLIHNVRRLSLILIGLFYVLRALALGTEAFTEKYITLVTPSKTSVSSS